MNVSELLSIAKQHLTQAEYDQLRHLANKAVIANEIHKCNELIAYPYTEPNLVVVCAKKLQVLNKQYASLS